MREANDGSVPNSKSYQYVVNVIEVFRVCYLHFVIVYQNAVREVPTEFIIIIIFFLIFISR